jgi:putative protein kinase ArgK-like GTPase of G3E family
VPAANRRYSRAMATRDESGGLSDRERARIERRDRRGRPRMLVENAGVRRVMSALAWRRQQREAARSREGESGS